MRYETQCRRRSGADRLCKSGSAHEGCQLRGEDCRRGTHAFEALSAMTQLECQHPGAPSRRQQRNDDGPGGDIAAVDHSRLGASEGAGNRVVRITGDATELRGHLEGVPMSEDRTEFVAVPVAYPQDQTD